MVTSQARPASQGSWERWEKNDPLESLKGAEPRRPVDFRPLPTGTVKRINVRGFTARVWGSLSQQPLNTPHFLPSVLSLSWALLQASLDFFPIKCTLFFFFLVSPPSVVTGASWHRGTRHTRRHPLPAHGRGLVSDPGCLRVRCDRSLRGGARCSHSPVCPRAPVSFICFPRCLCSAQLMLRGTGRCRQWR